MPNRRETFAQREARLDATVWRDEIEALRYESIFVRLRDDLRRATNKISVLAEVPFREMVVPTPRPTPRVADLGIRVQNFDLGRQINLSAAAWKETLARLAASGWRVVQAEWTHERFVPARSDRAAHSEFAFEIHGERLSARTRFIVRGTMGVAWEQAETQGSPKRPDRLEVTKLSVLEREGAPGFNTHASITPLVPEGQAATVDLHPLIVTDVNRDGNEDIIVAEVNKLFLNDGAANFTALDFIPEKSFRGANKAGVIGDFNGDGQLDLLTVGTQGAYSNHVVLYSARGADGLNREPEVAWAGARVIAPSVMTAGDIDRDGDLDIWLAQYKPPYIGGQVPTPYYDANDGYPSFLLLNDGRGKFVEATARAGLSARRNRRTFSASLVDLNADGNLDLLTVNDFSGLDLYHGDGQGRFTDETQRLPHRHLFGMAHTFADFDRDGVLDMFCIGMSVATVRRLEAMNLGRTDHPERTRKRVDMTYGNRLLLSRGGQWTQPAYSDELARTGWSWGTTAADFDNDGDIDVYVANGFISGASTEDYCSHCWRHDMYLGNSRDDPQLLDYFSRALQPVNTGKTSWNGHQHEALFLDLGANDYANVAFLMGVAHETDCRAVVAADLNNDGRRDLVLTERQWFVGPSLGRHRVLVHLNQLSTSNHWIGVKLSSGAPGVSALGATVTATTVGRKLVAAVVSGDSFQCQHPSTVHFGLGPIAQVGKIMVRWPDGTTQVLENPQIDRYHQVTRY